MADKKYVRATTGFMLPDRTIVKAGQIVAATDRVVKGREELFEPMEDSVEAATRAPGEKRLTVKRPDIVVLTAAGSKRAQQRAVRVKAEADKKEAERLAAEEAARVAAEEEAKRLAAEQDTGGGD